MTNTMKIYENGKLVEVVKRPALPKIIPVLKRTHKAGVDFAYTPRSVRIARRRNKLGSNQFKTRRHGEGEWKKTLLAGFILILFIGIIGHSAKVYFAPKPLISPLPTTAYAAESVATKSAELVTVEEPAKKEIKHFEDARAEKVWDYLFSNGSPLSDYADVIVKEADKNDIPWTLVAAISGKESSFGKAIPQGSNNAWGVMDWKTDPTTGQKIRFVRKFESWEAGIRYVSVMLSENYRKNMNQGIQSKYCPSSECSNSWVTDVTHFQEEINND